MPTNVWNYKLELSDVFHDDELSLDQKTQQIASRIEASSFWKLEAGHDDLECIVEELKDAGREDDFDWWDGVWNMFYDWADANRVWVNTI